MGTKIYSVTIVDQQGGKSYYINNSYRGLLLDKIEDKSIEFPDSYHSIYRGFTMNGETVFEAIDAPVCVEYCEAPE